MVKKSKKKSSNFIAENRRARFDFELLKQYEAGISLEGWEVRSLRLGKAQIAEAYVLLKDSEAWLLGSYIVPLNNNSEEQNPTRTRKLLLNKKELAEIFKATQQKGETCVPLNLFWKDNLVKCQISTAKGKKSQDKRQTIKSRDWERQKARELRTRSK
ncbi:MAG: SsrA-binding protein SmpB [Pseudomonadota bacterium]|nr:SsrA-binding protein [Gammaproteobacteria bacterium]MEC7917703.1 SsrA-binding protein SmpB [Pseudomonadota bacterium]